MGAFDLEPELFIEGESYIVSVGKNISARGGGAEYAANLRRAVIDKDDSRFQHLVELVTLFRREAVESLWCRCRMGVEQLVSITFQVFQTLTTAFEDFEFLPGGLSRLLKLCQRLIEFRVGEYAPRIPPQVPASLVIHFRELVEPCPRLLLGFAASALLLRLDHGFEAALEPVGIEEEAQSKTRVPRL